MLSGTGQREYDLAEWWFLVNPTTLAITTIALAITAAVLVAAWWRYGRDLVYVDYPYRTDKPRAKTRPLFYSPTVVIEYQPPEEIRPAQAGVLLHERVTSREITATIADFAARGLVSIEEIPRGGVAGRPAQIKKLAQHSTNLLPWEATILDGLFQYDPETTLSAMTGEHYTTVRHARDELYEDVAALGWFTMSLAKSKALWTLRGQIVMASGAALTIVLGAALRLGFVGLVVTGAGAMLLAMRPLMAQRTAKGSELLRRCFGFRMYVAQAEKARNEFDERQALFTEYLGYAIVFESVDKWADAFADVNTDDILRLWVPGGDPGMS